VITHGTPKTIHSLIGIRNVLLVAVAKNRGAPFVTVTHRIVAWTTERASVVNIMKHIAEAELIKMRLYVIMSKALNEIDMMDDRMWRRYKKHAASLRYGMSRI
jgi:hypothetical protein